MQTDSSKNSKGTDDGQIRIRPIWLVPWVLAFGLLIYIAIGIIFGKMAFQPTTSNGFVSIVQQVLPQGWSFFTRDATSQDMTAYNLNDSGEWDEYPYFPAAHPQNNFGVSRIGRAHGIELGTLNQELTNDAWTPCETQESIEGCLSKNRSALHSPTEVANIQPNAHLCGKMMLVQYNHIDWSYREYADDELVPAQFAAIDAKCTN